MSSRTFSPIESDHFVPSISSCDQVTQTNTELSEGTPRKRKLRKAVKRLQNEKQYLKEKIIKLGKRVSSECLEKLTLEDYKRLTHKFCPSTTVAHFINAQVSQFSKEAIDISTEEFKNYCLSLYFQGPKLYKNELVKTFCLPSIVALRRFIQNIKVSPGINDSVFKILKKK